MGKNGLKGWIVSNGGLALDKFTEQLRWLEQTMLDCGLDVRQVRNSELIAGVRNGKPVLMQLDADRELARCWNSDDSDRPDFVLFWDKDVRLAASMEQTGFRLFNPAAAIAACDDKSVTHRILAGHGIAMPDTLTAPFFYPGLAPEGGDGFVGQVESTLTYPVVVKESFGSFGAQVHLASNREELSALHAELRFKPHICQKYVASSHGRDVRLQVVGDRVVAAMQRHSDTDFRANISSGGSMEAFEPPAAFQEMAVRATRLLGADFAGVDILFGPEGEPILCEVNSNAHMRNLFTCTGVDVTREITAHILKCLA